MIASTYPRFPGDGAARFVQSMAEAVAGLGHTVHVLAPYHPQVRPIPGPVVRHHFRYIWPDRFARMGYAQAMHSDRRLRLSAFVLIAPYLLAGALALRRLMARHHYDVLHAHWVIPNGLMALPLAKRGRVPLVISLHGSDGFVTRHNPVFASVARQVFRRASAVTACSPELQADAARLGAPPALTHLVPWGADPAVFGRPAGVPALRQRWGLRPDQPTVVAVGRLVAKKGLDYLIQAVPAVRQSLPDVRFLIVGDGPERARLAGLAARLGVTEQVRFTGMVAWDEVPGYLQLGDVFVLPSIHDDQGNADGMPTTLLEAMAAGKPVVASQVGGIPLAVAEGVTGYLVDERQPQALAEALLRVLGRPDRGREMGRAGRQRVESDLNWDQIARRLVDLYQQALARPAQAAAVG